MKQNSKPIGQVVVGVIAITVLLVAILIAKPMPKAYGFIHEDHPVDMWGAGHDKWAYYSIGQGTTESLAAEVRSDLQKEGYTEDKTHRPWFRFVKGDKEVLVCNHDEFAVNGNTLVQQDPKKIERMTPPPPSGVVIPTKKWPCILVKNGPEKSESLPFFQIKKLIHGW
jgi:hypothetical protein